MTDTPITETEFTQAFAVIDRARTMAGLIAYEILKHEYSDPNMRPLATPNPWITMRPLATPNPWITDIDTSVVEYSYYQFGDEVGSTFPTAWLFDDDWKSKYLKTVEDKAAAKKKEAEELAVKNAERTEREERATLARLRAKYGD